jgi:hypothetical protein
MYPRTRDNDPAFVTSDVEYFKTDAHESEGFAVLQHTQHPHLATCSCRGLIAR